MGKERIKPTQNPRICPKCGKVWPDAENRCRASYGTPAVKCDTVTIPYIPDEPEDEQEDLREDLRGQADQIHDLLEEKGPLSYEEIGEAIGVSAKRATNIVSNMVRDGVELKREGMPRKVSIG